MEDFEARVNITWAGNNGDLPDPVHFDAADGDVKQWVTEALRAGIPGIPPAADVDLQDFVIDRFPPSEARPYNLIQVRPKTPFGARHAHEFSCTNCGHWNYPMLNETMNGNYTIVCGNCAHHHYRAIKDGRVTEDRHNSAYNHGDTIHVMPSACQKTKRQMGAVAQFRAMVAGGRAQ